MTDQHLLPNVDRFTEIPLWRKVVFAVLASGGILALAVLACETGLRLAGYGDSQYFFIAATEDSLAANPRFAYRYFGKSVPPRDTNWVLVPAVKPAGTYRIFILGGSAALGVPSPDFHFGRFLEVMLTHACPDQSFEVHNLALTAINSHVVRDIAQECAQYEPDLMIVYLGNNEVVGPFGPGSVFEGIGTNLGVLRMSVALKNTRLGQWLASLAPNVSGPSDWEGLQMFLQRTVSRDDRRLERVYDHLRTNLTAICDYAVAAGAKVLLGTVAVNLKDCPPFATSESDALPLIQEVADTLRDPTASGAKWIAKLQDALQGSPESAMLNYLLGQCLLREGKKEQAAEAFFLARDLDLLRFRADSRTNEVIRDVARMKAKEGVQLVDVESKLSESSPAGVLGEEYFYEHVHFNPQGQYALARTFLPQVLSALPQARCSESEPPIVSFDQCCRVLALTDLEHRGILKATLELIDKPPFSDQLGAADRRKKLEREVERLEAMIDVDQGAMARLYEQAVAENQDDLILRKLAGRFLLATGRAAGAERQFQVLAEADPTHVQALLLLGEAAYARGNYRVARERFDRFINRSPDRADALSRVSGIYLREGEYALALDYAEQAHALRPDRLSILKLLSRSQLAAGQAEAAYQTLWQVASRRPDDPKVRRELATASLQRGDFSQAAANARACLKQRPEDTQARLCLAMALSQLQQIESALSQYEQLLEKRPVDRAAEQQFLNFLRSTGRDKQAFDWCRERVGEEQIQEAKDLRVPLAELVMLQSLSRDRSVYDPAAALKHAERLQRLTPMPDLQVIELLAMAQAENEQFAVARKTAEQALSLAKQQRDRQSAVRLQQQLRWIDQQKRPSDLK